MTTWVTSKGEVIPTNRMHIKHLINAIKKLNLALKSKERKYNEAKDQYDSTKNRMNILLEELSDRKKMRIVQNGKKWMVVNSKNDLVYSSHDFDDCVQAMNEIVESKDNNQKLFDYGKYRRCIKVQHLYGDDAMASALADGFYKYKTNDRYDIYRHYEIDVLRYINKVSKNFHEKKLADVL